MIGHHSHHEFINVFVALVKGLEKEFFAREFVDAHVEIGVVIA